VKFTPAGGTITVAIRRDQGELEVAVADTGEGIAPEFLPYVFERFRQADASTSRRHGGLGIGLALVRQLIEMHHGRISVESPGTGQGSTFRVRLPASNAVHDRLAAVSIDHQTQPPVDFHRCLDAARIVVVDDQFDSREWLKRVLGEAGAEVFEASSAGEAFELVKDCRPQVLVSDIGMPGRDGYDLIGDVRGHPAGSDLVAIALTAYARPEERAKALKAGFQMHVAKPIDAAKLVAVIAHMLKRDGSHEDNPIASAKDGSH
jgi:CheY-like chemotaxis protein